MTRKRAIKLLTAADGNGQPHLAAKILDVVKLRWHQTNEAALLYCLDRILIIALTLGRFDDAYRIQHIIKNVEGRR